MSQSTLSRALASLGPDIERLGTARATRYALRRKVRHLGNHWPLYALNGSGGVLTLGELRALEGGFRLIGADATKTLCADEYPEGLYPGLPFFLQDIRPQGYLGRSICQAVAPRLGLLNDPRSWLDDDLVGYLLQEGDDLPGNLILGDQALENALRRSDLRESEALEENTLAEHYPALALAAQRGELVGSSAGGEQPKFLTTLCGASGEPRSVLVKFSSADVSPVRDRWADLLVCEQLASEILQARQIPCAKARLHDFEGRRFLEVERFDRIGLRGRRGVLSLGSLMAGLIEEEARDWTSSATLLQQAGLMEPATARRVQWLACFGDLIGNSDLHPGNLSVYWDFQSPLQLAPVYDMLPMLFAPGVQGDLSERNFSPKPPMPAVAAVWSDAAQSALEFWDRVATHTQISASFRLIATQARQRIDRLIALA